MSNEHALHNKTSRCAVTLTCGYFIFRSAVRLCWKVSFKITTPQQMGSCC